MLLTRYIITISKLRPIQILYQIGHRINKVFRRIAGINYPISIERTSNSLCFKPWIRKPKSYVNGNFEFLNLRISCHELKTDWNENKYGMLWRYNLNYMDYLIQNEMDSKMGYKFILDYIDSLQDNRTAFEPYTISLRGINWIKFLTICSNNFTNQKSTTNQNLKAKIDYSLYAQYLVLYKNLEYHNMANHLLENGFSLLFGAYYFNDEKLYNKASQIIKSELNEQILSDGAHFELSTMYHQIILDRLLDCINLLQNNHIFFGEKELLDLMITKAHYMLSWVKNISFTNGEIPLLNDSTSNIAPTSKQLYDYATRLGLDSDQIEIDLSVSGYRKFNGLDYECLIDVGSIGPDYQPGHSHADTFNTLMNISGKSFLVDTGISTYEAGKTRLFERGTAAHNTITILDKNSSDVWSSFRVGRRARVRILKEDNNTVLAQHNGYKFLGVSHFRKWEFSKDQIFIYDQLKGKYLKGKAHFWLAPQIIPVQHENLIETKSARIIFSNANRITILKSQIPSGFNHFSNNFCIEVDFDRTLITQIIIHH